MGEIKQTNFRINQDTAEKFRKFCEAEGFNQAQGFDHLIQVLELDTAKAVNPERKTEIEAIEMHIKAIMEMYLNGLELAKTTEDRVREDFKNNLESKDKTIAMLQEKIEVLSKQLQEAAEKEAAAHSTKEEAEKRLEQAEKEAAAAHELAEKTQKINDMLNGRMAETEAELSEYKELKGILADKDTTIGELKAELQQKIQEIADTKKDHSIELERAAMDKERAVNKAKDKYQEQIIQLREEIAALKAQLQVKEEPKEEE